MQPVFIVAGKASGARRLADILNRNGLACLGAAFDVDTPYDYAFGRFLRSANVGAAELIAAPDEVLDEYLGYCAGLVRAERFCLELGYHCMHLFNGGTWMPGQRPRLIDCLRQRRWRVVHFTRRQVFEHAVRLQMPGAGDGLPPAAPEGTAAAVPFTLDIARCERDMRWLARLSTWMTAWFKGHDGYHDLAYEAVFEAGMVNDSGAGLLEAIFGLAIANRAPQLALEHHDYRRLIANAGEVTAAFAGGPQAREVRDLLG
jgi:hypothetical protein